MNPKYVFTGIQHAATTGSTVAVESLPIVMALIPVPAVGED
jgi:hypothetical protein